MNQNKTNKVRQRLLLSLALSCVFGIALAIPSFHIRSAASSQKAVELFANHPDKFSAVLYQGQEDKSLWRLALAAHDYLLKKPDSPERECSFAMAYWGAMQPGLPENVPAEAGRKLRSFYDEAARDTQDAAERLPSSPEAHLTYGRYLQYFVPGMEKVPQMLKEFRKAVALRPNDGATHYYLGLAYMGCGDDSFENVERIIDQMTRAVRLNPRLVDCYYYLAAVYDWPSHLDLSRSQFYLDKYLKLAPDQANRTGVKRLKEDLQKKLGK